MIEGLVRRAVEPAALGLSFRAAERGEQGRERRHAPWEQRLERAEYEAARARRQDEAVDPEDRLVARALERQGEEKRAAGRRLEEGYARSRSEQPRHLTASDRDHLRALAADLPALWRAEATTGAGRRAVVRLPVEGVAWARHGETECVVVVVHGRGGPVPRHDVSQGLRRYADLGRYEELRGRVLARRGDGRTADRIADALNRAGYAVPRGERYTGHRVRQLFARFGLTGVPAGVRAASDLPARGERWLPGLAAERGGKPIVVHRWRWSSWLHARQLPGDSGRWIVRADAAEMRRLRRLRAFEIKYHGRREPPAELTAPLEPKQARRRKTPEHSGGK